MSRVRDAWYIRLPNGQEIRAKSTAAVLHHLQNGAIPKTSRARRTRDEEWMLMEWHAEFTEAVGSHARPKELPAEEKPAAPPRDSAPAPVALSGIAARLDPMRLRTVGIRGLLDDLIAALDSTFTRDKLFVAAVAGGLIGLIWGLLPWLMEHASVNAEVSLGESKGIWLWRFVRLARTLIAIVVLAWANGLLAHMTHLELSSMRRVSWQAGIRGYMGRGMRMVLAYLAILGGAFLLMTALRWLPHFVFRHTATWGLPAAVAELVPVVLSVIGVTLEALLWLLAALTWLLAPVLVGEDFPLGPGIREWVGLIRSQFNRIVLAETLALALGALVALPILLPIDHALGYYPHVPLPLQTLAYGLALAGFLAFMAVANVFTYLEVKYEQTDDHGS